MLDRVVFSCQQNRVNTFYKCIEFQVNSFELLRNFNYTKTISQISMYYAKTRADNSGYTNHRVICLVVIGSSFNSEQVSNGYLLIVFVKWTLTKNLTNPDADVRVTTIA